MAKSMGFALTITVMVAKNGGLDMEDDKFALHGFLIMIVNEEMTH
jgi:hypothetical protein